MKAVDPPFIPEVFKENEAAPSNIDEDRPETYKGIYAMHKYWSKKPHDLIAKYIERFSTERDIVLDAFCFDLHFHQNKPGRA